VRDLLCGPAGPSESASGSVFPDAVHRLFRGAVVGAGIAWRVADSLSLRSFLDLELTEAAPDHSTLSRTRRRIDVETHEAVFTWVLEVGSGAVVRSGSGSGEDGRHRCDDAGSERGDAEHQAAGHGRIPRSVHSAVGGSVRCGDPDAGGSGSVRPVPEEEDVEQGVEVPAGPGREDREDERTVGRTWPTRPSTGSIWIRGPSLR